MSEFFKAMKAVVLVVPAIFLLWLGAKILLPLGDMIGPVEVGAYVLPTGLIIRGLLGFILFMLGVGLISEAAKSAR